MAEEESLRTYLYSAVRFENHDKKYVLGLGQDITELKLAMATTRESVERFRQIAENIEEVFFLLDKKTKSVLYVSPAISTIFGLSMKTIAETPLILAEVIHPDDQNTAQFADESLRYSKEISEEFRIIRKDGDVRWIRLRSFLIKNEMNEVFRVAGVVADITEQKSAQEKAKQQQVQLIQADKMASLGLLISGVAHEINNPTNFITLNTPLLRRICQSILPVLRQYSEDNDDFSIGGMSFSQLEPNIIPLIDGIASGAARIKNIVADLKEYARLDTSTDVQFVNLNKVVTSSLSLVGHVLNRSTEKLIIELAPEDLWFKGSFQRIEQVVINLLQNAADALTSRTQSIKVITEKNREKKHIVLKIIDEGKGIDAKDLQKITDPFFTTKRDSGGTGLGLSISSGIVKDHHGDLLFESIYGKGTTVSLVLPLEEKEMV
jgi:PAS domain S-box-containing protein